MPMFVLYIIHRRRDQNDDVPARRRICSYESQNVSDQGAWNTVKGSTVQPYKFPRLLLCKFYRGHEILKIKWHTTICFPPSWGIFSRAKFCFYGEVPIKRCRRSTYTLMHIHVHHDKYENRRLPLNIFCQIFSCEHADLVRLNYDALHLTSHHNRKHFNQENCIKGVLSTNFM